MPLNGRQILIIGSLTILVGLGLFACWASHGSTPAFIDSEGNRIPQSVAEERWMTLGGVEQYVLIRGINRNAPILVNVHGGPGMTERALYRFHNAALEEHFVVVYWDQRGAGKSFDKSLDPSTLSIERMSQDLTELIDRIRSEFGKEKVLLLAHSWGTVISIEHIARRPETVAAYIGVGQVTNVLESETDGYNWLLSKALSQHELEIVNELRAMGPPPWTAEQFLRERDFLYKLNGFYAEPPSPLRYIRDVLSTPETTWTDILPMFNAMPWTIGHLWEENQLYDAFTRHKALNVPIFLMLGEHDHAVSPRLSAAWLDALQAPHKESIWFDTAGHMVPAEDPEAFNQEMMRIAQEVGLFNLIDLPAIEDQTDH